MLFMAVCASATTITMALLVTGHLATVITAMTILLIIFIALAKANR